MSDPVVDGSDKQHTDGEAHINIDHDIISITGRVTTPVN